MNLPPTFFYKFFKENTFFVVNNTIYNPKPSEGSVGFFKLQNKKFGIDKGLELSELENLYFNNNENNLKKYENNILQDILSDEKELSEDYHKLGQDLEFVEFVLNKLIKKNKKSVQILNIEKKNSCLINKLFNQNCFVWNGKIYSLDKDKKSIFSARINNQNYSIGREHDFSLKTLEKNYLKCIKDKLYNKLTKGKSSLFDKIKRLKEQKDLINIIKKSEFFDAKENIGFKKSNKGFFVTTKVKPYILYEPQNKKYYKFNEALIGISLVKENNKINWQDPLIINSYIHPALPSATPSPYQKICNGDFDYNKATKGKNLESSIRILLAQATRMIERGYYGERGAWSALTEPKFQKLEVKNFDPKEVTNK